MENGAAAAQWSWSLKGNDELDVATSATTIGAVLAAVKANLGGYDGRTTIPLGHGDPSAFPCFRTAPEAEEAVVEAVRSAKFNGYTSSFGLPSARRSVAEYLSRDLPYNLSEEDVYMTVGAFHAIEILTTVLARPGANILLPRPGYPLYEARASFSHLEVRHFDLLPERDWEVDINGLEALADDKTVAMVLVNPGNPCGNVFSFQHLHKVAEIARNLGIIVIADEVYSNLAFGRKPFVPMGVFGSIVPVITIGSISKRWVVPGWRLGWIATCDPSRLLQESGMIKSLKSFLNVTANPTAFLQGAVTHIFEKTTEDYFSRILNTLREAATICYERLQEIPCLSCPCKAEGAMFAMVKLNLELLDDIKDDMDFSFKLATEESVIVLPGFAVGMRNWIRITFSLEISTLEDGLGRMKTFCLRHSKIK